jgi:alpha-D-ribose 1-methylphosphonate 5-triphosphate diphosphatase
VTGGRLVTAETVLEGFDLVARDNRIAAIEPRRRPRRDEEVLQADGGWVLPGLVDIHADYIEHMVAPRPTSVMDFGLALREAERELVTHGITTMFHSLAFYAFSQFSVPPLRDPRATGRMVQLIEGAHRGRHVIRHRLHARFEIDSLDRRAEVEGYLRAGTVHLLSFMDHTPGQGQYRDLDVYRSALKAWRGLGEEAVEQSIAASRSRRRLPVEEIAEMAELARSCGVAVASHDDDSAEKVSLVHGLGARISEFPTSLDVALEARARGMHVAVGAPNVLLGGSHTGNLSAEEAVRQGAADVLCSDYYPPSLLHALFRLARTTGRPFAELVRLVSLHPAQAARVDGELGSLEKGKRADILVVHEIDGGLPVVTDAVIDGCRVFSLGYREAER